MSTLLQPRERKHFLGFLWAEGPMHWDCSVAQGGSHRTCSREEERQTGRDKWRGKGRGKKRGHYDQHV